MKISIITATYNSARTLVDTMESVLSQTYTDIEYIVVDGGSKDGTIDIIRQYEPRFEGRMKWVSEPDKGIYDAMNKGIQRSTGDVVGLLNSDDYFTTNDVIVNIAPVFNNKDIDAVYGDIHFIKNDTPDKCIRYYSSAHFSKVWLRFGFMPAHPSFYARRRVFDKAGLYKTDYRIGSDYEMMVRLFWRYQIKAEYIKKDFVTMRAGGLSTKNLRSKMTLVNDDVRACRENGVYTNKLMICTKFLYKIFEFKL
jgi:glycosyltransferase involved in cell wall biosynthesis